MSKERGGCDCLDTVGERLAAGGHYLKITMGSLFGGVDRPVLVMIRKDTDSPEKRRGKPSVLIPTFCPFCGLKYPTTPAPKEAPT